MAAELSLEEELLADLRMTRDVLVQRGHTQGFLINPENDRVCLTGAAAIARIASTSSQLSLLF